MHPSWRFLLKLLALNLIVVGGFFAYRQLAFRGPIHMPQPLPMGAIVDNHVHAAGLGEDGSGCYVSEAIKDSYKLTEYLKAFGATREDLKKYGDRYSIEKIAKWVEGSATVKQAVVLAVDGAVDEKGELDLKNTEFYVPNEFVLRETKKYPRLKWGASINPLRKDAIERLDAAKADGAVLIKWLPPIQGFDPANPKLTEFYVRMRYHELPLLSHTGQERSFTRADDSFADPRKLKLALNLGVTVIAAHAATTGETDGRENIDWLLEMLPVYPNLYADISSLTQINKLGYLRKLLLDKRSRGKLIYGSDFPLSNTKLVSPYYFPLDLTWAMMRKLAGIENPFDRDVALKQALGVPAEVFTHPLGK